MAIRTGGRGRRRRGGKNVIDLQKSWKVKQLKRDGGMTVQATPLTVNLDETGMFNVLGRAMVKRMHDVITGTSAQPKESTIKRRGPGSLFNVRGNFVRSIRFVIRRGNLIIENAPGALSPGVRGWLQRRIKETRPIEIKRWMAREGLLARVMRTEVIDAGQRIGPGGGDVPHRLGGIGVRGVRSRRR